jgi:hypothetical protein
MGVARGRGREGSPRLGEYQGGGLIRTQWDEQWSLAKMGMEKDRRELPACTPQLLNNNNTNNNINCINTLQKKAIHIVTGSGTFAHTEQLFIHHRILPF